MNGRPSQAGAGFTLLEIILAVSIAVVFMGGAVVSLSTTSGDRDLEQARRMLEEEVGTARELALESGRDRWISLSARSVGKSEFPGEVEMDLVTPRDRILGKKGWGKPQDYPWLVSGGGLVEPIRVRLRHGANSQVFEFNPLTGESQTRPGEQR